MRLTVGLGLSKKNTVGRDQALRSKVTALYQVVF
jgi:hypothetical protein